MRAVALICARGGSKGVPGKNVRPLGGRPLIAWAIAAARVLPRVGRVIVSTDSMEIADVARTAGADVPFMRPAEIALDDTPHLPVMQHAVAWLRDREQYMADWVMILMPTSPLRQARHIVEAVELAMRPGTDAVVSVDAMPPHFHPLRALTVDEGGWAHLFVGAQAVRRRPVRRQDMPPAWVFNGAIYLFRTPLLFDPVEPSLYGDNVAAYAMERPWGLNIDEPEDWEAAERVLAAGAIAKGPVR